jgi:hypothetical protein
MAFEKRIPLFPLEMVLFPGAALPLHIFEQRYKLMIRRCKEKGEEFGVTMARPGGIAAVGCTAAILEVARTYTDGRMDILTLGRTRYRMIEVLAEQPYYEARVEMLDEPERPANREEEQRLTTLYDQCHKLIYGRPGAVLTSHPGHSLTFDIVTDLPMGLDYRQTLLEIPSEAERRNFLFDGLTGLLPRLMDRNRMSDAPGSNAAGIN